MTDEARAVEHLQRAIEIIDRINRRVDPRASEGLPKLIAGRAGCCAKQAQHLVERLESEFERVKN